MRGGGPSQGFPENLDEGSFLRKVSGSPVRVDTWSQRKKPESNLLRKGSSL